MPELRHAASGPGRRGHGGRHSPSDRLCIHCSRGGSFVEPDLTRKHMIEEYAPQLAAELGMPIDKATSMVAAFTTDLPRWR